MSNRTEVRRCEAHATIECWVTWRWLDTTQSWVFDSAVTAEVEE